MEDKLERIREKLIEYYGLDIHEAKCFFSTQNYAFIFPDQPNMIRVSIGKAKTREETMSEVLWVDDLKQFSETVCEPFPSLNHHIVEEFEIDATHYRAAMFRTARGNVRDISKLDPMYFISVGDFLGRIHAASADGARQGITYRRKKWYEKRQETMEKARGTLSPELMARIDEIYGKVRKIPEDPLWFGMIHGDFHINNYFVDGNNIWAFDFDECCYGYFLYDIASACITWLMYGYKMEEGKTRRQTLYEDILPYFKIGYELHVQLPKEHWDLLELFLEDRSCVMVTALSQISGSGILKDIEATRQFVSFPLTQKDILDGFDMILKKAGTIQMNYGNTEQTGAGIGKEEGKEDPTLVTLPLHGKMDAVAAPALEQTIEAIREKGCRMLVLDCSDLQYVSSAGIRVFLKAFKKFEKFRMVGLKEDVREVLAMTGLLKLLG